MMEDKDTAYVAKKISEFAKRVIVTQVNMPRCLSAVALAKLFPDCQIEADSILAVRKAMSEICDDEIVCICGSLYLAGELRKVFKT